MNAYMATSTTSSTSIDTAYNDTMPSSTGTILLYFLAIWLPFLPVAIRRGCSADLFINILLCCLGWIPGIIHAWYIISKTERHPGSMGHPDGKKY
ncbi:plasma membrane proteolipid 3 family protein [Parastagonospora nodorum]|nr:plasma membrane proteolipid 3 family protein [Parastagonospora nodorum]